MNGKEFNHGDKGKAFCEESGHNWLLKTVKRDSMDIPTQSVFFCHNCGDWWPAASEFAEEKTAKAP